MGNEMAKAKLCATVTGGKGYGISHSWDGSVLTVTSDSGSSSADLMGPQGPRGLAGAEQFVVEVTETQGTYTANQSFEAVRTAIDNGTAVACDWVMASGTLRGQLTMDADTILQFTFHSFLGADNYLNIYSDGTVTHMTAETEDEKIPDQVSVVKSDSTVTVTAVYGFTEGVTTIALNDNGDPISVTRDGETTSLTWEGFDE